MIKMFLSGKLSYCAPMMEEATKEMLKWESSWWKDVREEENQALMIGDMITLEKVQKRKLALMHIWDFRSYPGYGCQTEAIRARNVARDTALLGKGP